MKIYIASSLENFQKVQEVRDALTAYGHILTYDWTLHGDVRGQCGVRLREVAEAEINGVREADLVVVLLPGGRGTHAELGMANALGKQVLLVSDCYAPFDSHEKATCAFYWPRNVSQVVVSCGEGKFIASLVNAFFRGPIGRESVEQWCGALRAELALAEEKHPDWPSDVIHAAAILQEEAGELIQAALDYYYADGSKWALITEAQQCGAMALRFLLSIEKYEKKQKE
jgi:hypothetical protein